MVSASVLQKLLVLLPFSMPTPAPPIGEDGEPEWSYDNVNQWGVNYQTCDGYRQSPVHLRSGSAFFTPSHPLRFENYDVPLSGPLKVVNNGHTVNMDVPPTRNGQRPSIIGGKLLYRYEAVGVHFHWGSPNNKGSEHIINNQRYDVEMHILHKNVYYETVEEATEHSDGLAVLGVMINTVNRPDRYYPGLNKILNRLPHLIEYESKVKINGQLSLGQLLGDVNTENLYTYKGSLTTPPCSEGVTWIVFPDPLLISRSQINKFFDLIDSHDEALLNNFRPAQPLDGRKVIYSFIADFPLFGPF